MSTKRERLAPGASSGAPFDPWLGATLRCLDTRLHGALAGVEEWFGSSPGTDPFRGLYVRRNDVERVLSRPAASWIHDDQDGAGSGPGRSPNDPDHGGGGPGMDGTGPLVLLQGEGGLAARWAWLAGAYQLGSFDLDAILVALAPEVDTRYERIYGYLQDDVTKRRPSVELVLRLLSSSSGERLSRRARLTPDAPLVRRRLLLLDDPGTGSALTASLRVDPQIVHLLLGIPRFDPRLAGILEPAPALPCELDTIPEGARARLWSRLRSPRIGGAPLRLFLEAPAGAGKRTIASAIAAGLDRPFLILDAGALLGRSDSPKEGREILHLALREAWFRDAVLYLRGIDRLAGGNAGREWTRILAHEASGHPGVLVLGSETSWSPEPGALPGLLPIPVEPPDALHRRAIWRSVLEDAGLAAEEETVAQIAARFVMTPGQIVDAVGLVALDPDLAGQDDGGEPGRTDGDRSLAEALFAAARAQCGHPLEAFARRIHPAREWDEIVLPEDSREQLREMCAWVRGRVRVMHGWGFARRIPRGQGVTALFTGPSGTGKTLAAEIVAGALGVDLFSIDLAGVVSKYIGDTEKNLDQIFRAAERANGVLFFDEADAIFGKRSEVRDSHDRYANLEISYLLQKMEAYDGIAILATNLRDNLDDAFVRRLTFSVHFPFPDVESREKIWEGVWPDEVPLDSGLDFGKIARGFALSGGNIRNCALAAAHLASDAGDRIGVRHLARAIRREFQKLGKDLPEAEILRTVDPDPEEAAAEGR